MNLIVIALSFLSALMLTFARGAGRGFVYVYLPALIFLTTVSGLPMLGLPDPTPPTAAVYGILVGSVLRGRLARLRLTPVDWVFALLPVAYIVSAVRTEFLYTGVSIFGSLVVDLVAPYFIARCALEERSTQREAVVVLVCCVVVVALFALIELRLWPNTYHELIAAAGLRPPPFDFAYGRFGVFRATTSFVHPIDLGISAALILVMIALLAVRSGVGLRTPWVRAGLAAALIAWFSALSFTSFMGFTAGLACFLVLRRSPAARRHLPVLVIVLIVVVGIFAAAVGEAPLPPRPSGDSALADSYWVRQLIIKEGWNLATSAGLFGWGRLVEVGILKSIDNAYLLIAIQRGWIALALWLGVFVFLAVLASQALRSTRSRRGFEAVLLGFCGTVGTMVAMFTVYLGCVYQSIFVVLVALTVNSTQFARIVAREKPRPAPALPARPARSTA